MDVGSEAAGADKKRRGREEEKGGLQIPFLPSRERERESESRSVIGWPPCTIHVAAEKCRVIHRIFC